MELTIGDLVRTSDLDMSSQLFLVVGLMKDGVRVGISKPRWISFKQVVCVVSPALVGGQEEKECERINGTLDRYERRAKEARDASAEYAHL